MRYIVTLILFDYSSDMPDNDLKNSYFRKSVHTFLEYLHSYHLQIKHLNDLDSKMDTVGN